MDRRPALTRAFSQGEHGNLGAGQAPTTPTLVGVGEIDLLFGGMSHAIYAPSGSGKTWLALAMLLDVVRATARPALLLDRKASLPVMVTRARQVGATG